MSDEILREAIQEAFDNNLFTAEDLLESVGIMDMMKSIVHRCTPDDYKSPEFHTGMTIYGEESDWCSLFLPVKMDSDLSNIENKKLSPQESVYTHVGEMFVNYGLSFEEHQDGLVLVVRRDQKQLLKQLSDDLDTAIKKTGMPALDIRYQPQ